MPYYRKLYWLDIKHGKLWEWKKAAVPCRAVPCRAAFTATIVLWFDALLKTTQSVSQEESCYTRHSNRRFPHTSQKRYSSNQLVWKLLCILSWVKQHNAERSKNNESNFVFLPHIILRAGWNSDNVLNVYVGGISFKCIKHNYTQWEFS